jgi:hypothetical protein
VNIRKALMQAAHELLGQSPVLSEQDRNLAAIEILQFVKQVDLVAGQVEQLLAQKLTEEMQGKGMAQA